MGASDPPPADPRGLRAWDLAPRRRPFRPARRDSGESGPTPRIPPGRLHPGLHTCHPAKRDSRKPQSPGTRHPAPDTRHAEARSRRGVGDTLLRSVYPDSPKSSSRTFRDINRRRQKWQEACPPHPEVVRCILKPVSLPFPNCRSSGLQTNRGPLVGGAL